MGCDRVERAGDEIAGEAGAIEDAAKGAGEKARVIAGRGVDIVAGGSEGG